MSMVYIVLVRNQINTPINKFNYPKVNSVYSDEAAALERCQILMSDSHVAAYYETYDVLHKTSFYENAYDERYYKDLKDN